MRKSALFLCLSALSLTAGFGKRSARFDEADRFRISLNRCKQRGISLAKSLAYSEARETLTACYQQALDTGDRLFAAQLLTNLGNLKLATHQYSGAMSDYLAAREMAAAIGDRRLAGYLALNMSSVYFQLWSFAESRRQWEVADRTLPPADREALAVPLLLQKARLDAWNGELGLAAETFRQAIEGASQKADIPTQALAWDLLGVELMDAGRLGDAEDAFVAAHRLRMLHDSAGLHQSYLKLALLRVEQNRAAEAVAWADRAIDAARRTAPRIPLYLFAYARGRALARQGELASAYGELRRALDWIRDFRLAELPADRVRAHTGGGLDAVFSEYIRVTADLFFRTGRRERAIEALEAAEENRAAGLRWSMSAAGRLRRELSPERAEALARLEAAHGRLFGAGTAEARAEVGRARQDLLDLELTAAANPASPPSTRFSAAELRRNLRDTEALFSFHLRDGQSLVWVVTAEGVDLLPLAGARSIRAAATRFARAVRDSSPHSAELGRELFVELFPSHPAARKPRWLVVPDDVLFTTPFAALNTAAAGQPPRYLIEEHSLSILPSAAMAGGVRTESAGADAMLALGDPIYNTADPRWRDPRPWWRRMLGAGADSAGLPRLPGAAAELERCARSWGPARLLAGESARWETLRHELEAGPAVVHLAAHLTPSPGDPRQMLLALGLAGAGGPELLGADTIRTLRIASPLVVLNGCSSAAGESLPAEGLRGMATAWLEAGARVVAASLWSSPDHAGELHEVFYARLRQFPDRGWPGQIDSAMQYAQVRMARSGGWTARPAYWAAYCLYGR